MTTEEPQLDTTAPFSIVCVCVLSYINCIYMEVL